MVRGIFDINRPGGTPGNPNGDNYHYRCAQKNCSTEKWADTIVNIKENAYDYSCHEHDAEVLLVRCAEQPCTMSGITHKIYN